MIARCWRPAAAPSATEHPYTLKSMNILAMPLSDEGKLDEAALNRQVLEARRRTLGPEHRDTLESMSNLAQVLKNQGTLGEAEPP